MPWYFIHKDGTVEDLEERNDDMEIDTSPECWTGGGKIEVGKCKNFSGKFMFPEGNKELN